MENWQYNRKYSQYINQKDVFEFTCLMANIISVG